MCHEVGERESVCHEVGEREGESVMELTPLL